jgi:hypothetical protein
MNNQSPWPISAAFPYVPRSTQWDSGSLLGNLVPQDITLSPQQIAENLESLARGMYTEFDSVHLNNYLQGLTAQGVNFSADFKAFYQAWQQDEWNHYLGSRKIYALCTAQSEDTIHQAVSTRQANFAPISQFFVDEFNICVVLAYDEIFTTRLYQQEFEFFKTIGHPNFFKWLREVTRDEFFHFSNAITVLRRQHSSRLPEVPELLHKFISWLLEYHPYQGTFVFDHPKDFRTLETLKFCQNMVLKYLYN